MLHVEILPPAQRTLWPELVHTPSHFVLYGGTALALQLGHRESVDFDFFSKEDFTPSRLIKSISYLTGNVISESVNTLDFEVVNDEQRVKCSFFGGLTLGQVLPPSVAPDNHIKIASTLDIFGMKCATVSQRNEVKDYIDIHACLTKLKMSLAEGIAAARAIYGSQYNPVVTLKALSYFADLRGNLSLGQKTDLLDAIRKTDIHKLPDVEAVSAIGDING